MKPSRTLNDEELEATLDWHYRADAGLERLRRRLPTAGGRRVQVLHFARRLAAVAALLLITIGLVGGLSPVPVAGPSQEVVAFLQHDLGLAGRVVPQHLAQEKFAPVLPAQEASVRTFFLDRDPQPVRVTREGNRLPLGPRVDLTLEIRNRGPRPLTLQVGERTFLRLDLNGPGTRTLVGSSTLDGKPPPFLTEQLVPLKPGASYFLPIPYLIGGQASRLQGVYWTAPGRYTLSVDYRVGVVEGTETRELRVLSSPMQLEVKAR
jgi:hypothetical protein